MPYINQHERGMIDGGLNAGKAGELNYQITSIVHAYLRLKGISYTTLNEAIGVLECAKLELYRRVVADYEDRKIAENGDLLP